MLQNGQEVLLDELDSPVLTHGKQAHHFVQIAGGRVRRGAEPAEHQQSESTPRHARGARPECARSREN